MGASNEPVLYINTKIELYCQRMGSRSWQETEVQQGDIFAFQIRNGKTLFMIGRANHKISFGNGDNKMIINRNPMPKDSIRHIANDFAFLFGVELKARVKGGDDNQNYHFQVI